MMPAIEQEIERQFLELMHADVIGPFDAWNLGEVLMEELRQQWPNLPTSTRKIMVAVGTELRRHHAVGILADRHAAQIVADMKGGPQ